MKVTSVVELPVNFSDETEYVNGLLQFINTYAWLWRPRNGANFVVQQFWERHFSKDWRVLDDGDLAVELKDLVAMANGTYFKDEWPESLKAFVRGTFHLALPRQPRDLPTPTVKLKHGTTNMKDKKRSEIEILGSIIHDLASKHDIHHVLDAGSGQGYLDLLLAHKFGYDVVAVDDNPIQHEGALRRNENSASTSNNTTSGSLTFVNHRITAKDTMSDIIPAESQNEQPLLLCGLHACGDLSPQLIRLFAASKESKALGLVGCCYNLLTEPESNEHVASCGFPLSSILIQQSFQLGYDTRNLACQATARWNEETEFNFPRLFYRALLQAVLVDFKLVENGDEVVIGRFRKKVTSQGFVVYARAALNRLKIDDSRVSDAVLEEYVERYKRDAKQFAIVWTLRAMMAGVLESLILMDRFMFVSEEARRVCTGLEEIHVEMYPIFDVVDSPRNMIITACKGNPLYRNLM
ncbi:hypothetical protein SmJEL517_g01287 [Synchytrium microbalum]|uniref:Methyltransferase domain-containing protein n=1 Tax=Synchytrium microbalum TaxID=1806994 RepID=A0A507CAI3_9FUNG|nr:uncharacterized protein SmJEL517_g01287 [Synchytrium microbalum]TPX36622.1 hypothetical protein SmJEL517_g01287 [Synchytrium microbalum]